jgi:hypothetical protein
VIGVCVDPRAGMPADVAGDHPDQRARVSGGHQGDVVGVDALVGRWDHLALGGQIHPQLHAVEQSPGDHQLLRRGLDVQDARACRHPLGGAVLDRPATTVGILVLKASVDHVSHGFESAMRMPGGALRLTGRILHLAHLVHVHERIQLRQWHSRESAMHRKTLALQPSRCGGHTDYPTLARAGREALQTGQPQTIGSYSGHS